MQTFLRIYFLYSFITKYVQTLGVKGEREKNRKTEREKIYAGRKTDREREGERRERKKRQRETMRERERDKHQT